jgi:hypothetical protein
VGLETLRPSLLDRIRADFPDLAPDALISRAELARYSPKSSKCNSKPCRNLVAPGAGIGLSLAPYSS